MSKEILLNLMCEVSFNIRTHLNPYRLVRELNDIPIESYLNPDNPESWTTAKISDFPRLQDYKYSTEVANNAVFNQAFETISRRDKCVKQVAPLLSLLFYRQESPRFTVIGAIFFSNSQRLGMPKEIICQSKTPGWHKLNKPYLKDGEPICGEDTSEFVEN